MIDSARRESLLVLGLVGLLALAVLLRSGLLLLVALLLGVTFVASIIWGRYALARLEYRRQFSPARCFAGEQVELTVALTNRKVLPVTYLTVDDIVPEELAVGSRKLRFLRTGQGVLRLLFGLTWYQKVIRHYTVRATRRGFYRLGPARLSGGDPFGYVERAIEVSDPVALVVYPHIVVLTALGIPARRPFGDLRSQDRLFPDPLLFAGTRDYQPGDPLNRVHWKASAAAGSLQVRTADPSSNLGLAVFLNTWSYELVWMGTDASAFETGCVVAASIVNWACEQGLPVGLYANGLVHEWGMNLRLPPTRGGAVLQHALEGLARLQPLSVETLAELLADEYSRLSYGTSMIVITRVVTTELATVVAAVQRSGRPVTLVLVGAGAGEMPALPGVRVYRVPAEEALHAAILA